VSGKTKSGVNDGTDELDTTTFQFFHRLLNVVAVERDIVGA
jgi:hypothetical protein|tara:strand:- start:22 stop:144 length:123 start_codon:yes stop_codon:yes gene_type:complete